MKYTLKQFQLDYPNDAACLDKLFHLQHGKLEACPACGVAEPKFKRISTRRSYQCRDCYYQIYPTKGTIFEKTRTPLTYWFYAIYLMTTTRNGVSAKEFERLFGVTYKTAFRMAHAIRESMGRKSYNKLKLDKTVEMDETYVGGKEENNTGRSINKAVVFGMVERHGELRLQHVPDATVRSLQPIIDANVSKSAKIMTDEYVCYKNLHRLGYNHMTILHNLKKYTDGAISTNTVEGAFSHLKRMIYGTHIWVSHKHLNRYIDEYSFRYNHRFVASTMFSTILGLSFLPPSPESH